MRRVLSLIVCLAVCACALAGCGGAESGAPTQKEVKRQAVESTELQFQPPSEGDPIAVFSTSMGEVRAVLYPQYAPMAVENFTGLARQGYFDGTSFHRVLYGFVVQGGDAGGTGTGGASIWNNEPFAPEVSASLRHYPGALCAAKSPESERSILSQFYFVQALPQTLESELQAQLEAAGTPEAVLSAYNAAGGLPYLDYTDTVFGQVYQGMEVVDAIALVEVDENGKPAEDVLINSVTISSYTAS